MVSPALQRGERSQKKPVSPGGAAQNGEFVIKITFMRLPCRLSGRTSSSRASVVCCISAFWALCTRAAAVLQRWTAYDDDHGSGDPRAARQAVALQGLAAGGGVALPDEQPGSRGGRAALRPGGLWRHRQSGPQLGVLSRHRPRAGAIGP